MPNWKLIRSEDEIQKSQSRGLIDILTQSKEDAGDDDSIKRRVVITQSLDILNHIHTAFTTPVEDHDLVASTATEGEDPALEDAKRRRLLHALLDLISLEGIYPSLSSGVGIPLQQRVISVLPAGVIAKQNAVPASSRPHDQALLRHIMGVLLSIMLDPTPSIQPVIRGRILSDIISGTADLVFNPNVSPSKDQGDFKTGFMKIIEECVAP